MDWPAYFPDLNPIEHVWDTLGRRIAARLHHPKNTQQLKQMLIEEWALLPQEMLHQLVLNNMLHKDETIQITASCDMQMMTKSEVSVVAIVDYSLCHTPRHRIKEALDVSLGYSSPCGFHVLSELIRCNSGRRILGQLCKHTFSIRDRSGEQAGEGSNSI
ncbi:transposable element Tc3 transposase [Trichonephila clavipes]|nr:transposable element Tc3 transposase [Trichonephila clavipes]